MGQDVLTIMGSSEVGKVKASSHLDKDGRANTWKRETICSNTSQGRKEEDTVQVYKK